MTTRAEWHLPAVEEVADAVFRIPLPLPNDALRAVNIYLITGDDAGPVCIDSGWARRESRDLLLKCLATLHVRLEDIARFLVTHMHRDHFSQAIAIRREVSTRVSLGVGERTTLELLATPSEGRLALRLAELERNGAIDLARRIAQAEARVPPRPTGYEMPDDWLRDGDVIDVPRRRLHVLETPGHTRGHVVFSDFEHRLLFAGDHVLSTITPSIGLEPSPSRYALGNFLASLARVRSLPDAVLLPAHGPVGPSVHTRVDELVAHHARRLDDVLAGVRATIGTAFGIAGKLTWTRHERKLDELDLFNQRLAVLETAAHLSLLEAQGRVRRTLVSGVDHYALS